MASGEGRSETGGGGCVSKRTLRPEGGSSSSTAALAQRLRREGRKEKGRKEEAYLTSTEAEEGKGRDEVVGGEKTLHQGKARREREREK